MLRAVVLGIAVVALAGTAYAAPSRSVRTKTAVKPHPAAAAKPVAPTPTPTPAPTPTPMPTPVASGTDPQPVGALADWFPADSYPPQARAKGIEGRVTFALDIDALGRITQCHVVEGSGSDLLDSATCTQAIINGRFRPGRDAAGKPVAKPWRSTMRWKLAEGAPTGDE